MKPTSEPIPGLRRPDAREQAWIAEHWGKEIEQNTLRLSGKIPRFIAAFLAAVGGASMVRDEGALDSAVVCLILAVICFAVSRAFGKTEGQKDRRLQALATGDYYVAQATSVRIGYIHRRGSRDGVAEVRLADGRVLEGAHWMPYRLAEPLINQKINNIPILVIQFPGEDRIFTIPVPR